ncbi:FAD-binding protein [Mesorhizobium sp. M00.F.Ca.ET.149.01.1.1]|nr:FAD-binding protein [Mesorhizobium sp. M00.F.Ca.ET.149.01.1.1]
MTETRSRQIVIAGAGIAGLTAALAFAERGFPVKLFEQAKQLEAAGAGLQLSPNATRILARLGVLERLLPNAIRPEAVVLKDARNLRELARVPLGAAGESRWGAPYLAAHRADLQAALMATVAQRPEIELVTGAQVTGIATGPQSVVATVETDGKATQAAGGLLLGADGVWSSVRAALAGTAGFAASRFSGELAWRATIAAQSAAGQVFEQIGASDCVTTFLHPGFHMVAYPVSKGSAFNLAAFTKGERIAEGWSGHADPAILSGANYIWHSAGWLEAGLTCGYSKFATDCEQLVGWYKYAGGVPFDDFKEAMAAIREVGPQGHFLGTQHTLEHFESAFFMPNIMDFNSFEQWSAEGAKDHDTRGREKARSMLADYQEPKLDESIAEGLADLISRREEKLPDSVS